MARVTSRRSGRIKGATVVIIAALLPVVIGGLALSVDTAVLATARAQLSTVADASALAGARKLATAGRLRGADLSSSDLGAAHNEAIAAGGRNDILGTPALLLPNASNANNSSADVVVGYIARPTDPADTISTSATQMRFANTVLVTARRDGSHSGAIPRFFSKIWSGSDKDMLVTSAAAVLGVTGYRTIDASTNGNAIPIVLDKVTYASMMRKETTDVYNAKGLKTPDGITESKLYPVGAGYPGNWGTIKIGVTNNSTSTLGSQIRNGIPPSQMFSRNGGSMQLSASTGTVEFEGNPGISAGIKDDLKSIVGKPIRIPIYDPAQSSGNGNNLVYTVVAYVPVVIVNVIFKGVHSYVTVQPSAVPVDPTTVWGGIGDGPLPVDYRLSLIR